MIVESACDLFAAHEIPQELGDFGILIHVSWSRHAALACDLASGSTVIQGGLLAYGLAGHADVTVFSSPSPLVTGAGD